jgi:hypothetical protein
MVHAANYQVLWNQVLRDVAAAHVHNNIDDSARLFALANLAMADAVITASDTKFHYVFWRPLTAIWNGRNDFFRDHHKPCGPPAGAHV